MFGLCCCGKRSAKVEDVFRQTDSSERSVTIPDTPTEKILWLYRLFGRPTKKRQCVATSEDKPSGSKKKAKKRWWRRKNKVAPSPEKEERSKEEKRRDGPEDQKAMMGAKSVSTRQTRRYQCRGFPNPAQFCYMNSCLQSLLTLEDFVEAFRSQEQVWSSDPEAALIRVFMDIRESHLSPDAHRKIRLLVAFKEAVSVWAPEFQDFDQKVRNLLFWMPMSSSVLDQIRSLCPQLQAAAASEGRIYSCPVEDHLVFKMQKTKTCKGCGAVSITEEEFTNLSLDLIPGGGTVEEMLRCYLKETELDYNCECGATRSCQRLSFVNLPKVLILHLKRFRFTPSFQLQKLHVDLFGDLVVSSNQGDGCLSLVSTISHVSYTAECGLDGGTLDGNQEKNSGLDTMSSNVISTTTIKQGVKVAQMHPVRATSGPLNRLPGCGLSVTPARVAELGFMRPEMILLSQPQ
ncbi:Ubiquitin carboxyl-terminal hydrolase 37 [Collichthys lucidus]|uniref:Ubiquitin carboxyl-terminal hydrolase 37 n=1 Tax=Collichthys lucidus TaxID=240159 RepID=A0A4U5U674_COLLU|nr:Ubiquitin carboxyl-terminal hydrolase 37 [Collichthys lucidus]